MNRIILSLLAIAFACLFSTAGHAQTKLCIPTNSAQSNCVTITSTFPLPVTGSITASSVLSGTQSNAASAIAPSADNLKAVSWLYGFNGATWDQLQVDGSKNLNVNCTVGCAGGTQSNASSGIATSADNGKSVSWLYGFNGVTWDQLQVDGSKFLKVTQQGTVTITGSIVSILNPVVITTSTAMPVAIVSGGGSGGTASTFGAAFPATGTAIGVISGSTMTNLAADTSGNLKISGAVSCSNCSGSGASAIDEAAFTAGTDVFAPAGGFFQTTATNNALTNGQQGMLQLTAQRAAFVNLRNASGVEIGTSTTPVTITGSVVNILNPVTVTGTVAATQSGVWNIGTIANQISVSTLTSITNPVTITGSIVNILNPVTVSGTVAATQSGVWNIGTVSNQISVSTLTSITNPVTITGSIVAISNPVTITGSIVNILNPVTVSGTIAATQSGTWTVQPGNTANTTPWLITGSIMSISNTVTITGSIVGIANTVSTNLAQVGGTTIVNGGVAGSQSIGGTVATNVAITANPINLGAQAVSSENAAVTTARQVQLVADLNGKLIVLPYANSENFVSGTISSANMTGTTSTLLVAAPASGLRNYITSCTFSNAHATVGTDMSLQDGSGGTQLWNVPAAAVYGGAALTFPTPLRQPSTATALYVVNRTTGAATSASCNGYIGK